MRRAVAGVIVALAVAVSFTPVVSAAPPDVEAVHAEFRNADVKGQVLVDRIDADGARVTAALGKLQPDHRYRLIFSTDPCSTPLPEADRIMAEWTRTDQYGSLFRTLLVGTDGGVWRNARSARLMEEEGIFYFCRAVSVLIDPDRMEDTAGAWARFGRGTRGLLGLHVDTSAIDLSLTGLRPGTAFRLIHSPLTCGQFNAGDPDAPIVVGSIRSNPNGMSFARLAIESGEEIALTTGSFRIERRSNGAVWGCANAHAFAVWLTVG